MSELYEFGPFRVDANRRVLLRDGKPLSMSNKAFDLLLVLVRDRERVLDKEELLDKIWPDTTVEENNLTVAMSGLRKALGEEPNDRRYIVTIPGRGYRFAADVRVVAPQGNFGEGTDSLHPFQNTSPALAISTTAVRTKRLAIGITAVAVLAAACYFGLVLRTHSPRSSAVCPN